MRSLRDTTERLSMCYVRQDLLVESNRRPTTSDLGNEQVYPVSEVERLNSTFNKTKMAPVSFSGNLWRPLVEGLPLWPGLHHMPRPKPITGKETEAP